MLAHLDTSWRYPLAAILGLATGLYIGGMLATLYVMLAFGERLESLGPLDLWFLRYPWAILAATMAGLALAAPAAAWEPEKPVEFVVPAGTGGGADQGSAILYEGSVYDGLVLEHTTVRGNRRNSTCAACRCRRYRPPSVRRRARHRRLRRRDARERP